MESYLSDLASNTCHTRDSQVPSVQRMLPAGQAQAVALTTHWPKRSPAKLFPSPPGGFFRIRERDIDN